MMMLWSLVYVTKIKWNIDLSNWHEFAFPIFVVVRTSRNIAFKKYKDKRKSHTSQLISDLIGVKQYYLGIVGHVPI